MFWRAMDQVDHLSICAGVLDQPTGLTTTTAWWVAEMADYHTRVDGLVDHDFDG